MTLVLADEKSNVQPAVVGVALAGLVALTIAAVQASDARQALLAPLGFFAGVALYHASFGFTTAWRRLLEDRRSLGLRAQIVMLGLAIVVFFPALSAGELFGQPANGFVFPVGYALLVGAFLFGIGMQLGGGCGSGTLYKVGGGLVGNVVTLGAFIAGSLFATAQPWGWTQWPDIGAYSLVVREGPIRATGFALAGLIIVYGIVREIEQARHGETQPLFAGLRGDFLRGPWPVVIGALALAFVNIATLLVIGRPWGITSAFALWGAKIAAFAGYPVAAWDWWSGEPALAQSVFADANSIMDFGVILGALAAAGMSGAFAPRMSMPKRSLVAAVLGGLLMGFGARLATGCNIGAYFSGIASGSLHGVVWAACAFCGSAIGVRLRPLFGVYV
ncbi:MAG: YeeE/YedE family protein [Hyphomicrobiales bacterium]|nr:YeeE/YedE family protein [Hyphomicrobiales bacterium]